MLALPSICGCAQKSAPPPPAPPEVSVVKLVATPVTVFEEYVGQTEAVDTVEIRARVGGILERQVFEDGARVKKAMCCSCSTSNLISLYWNKPRQR
jgi:multidrug efflux pump subunit AcrA (membrane-fusion protein)